MMQSNEENYSEQQMSDALLQLIDDYIKTNKVRYAEYSGQPTPKKSFIDTWNIEPFYERFNILQERYPNLDLTEFFFHFVFVRGSHTFSSVSESEILINGFNELKIQPPTFIKNCVEELERRVSFIDRFFERKLFNWNESEIKGYQDYIINESKPIYGQTKQLEFIGNLLTTKKAEIEALYNAVWNGYGVSLKGMYNDCEFIATKEDLNWYFINGESKKKNAFELNNLILKLAEFVKYKKQLILIEERLQELLLPPAPDTGAEGKKDKIKTIDTAKPQQLKDIADFKALRKLKNDDSETLKSMVKAKGIKESDKVPFKKGIDRLRIMLQRFNVIKTKEKATKKLQIATK